MTTNNKYSVCDIQALETEIVDLSKENTDLEGQVEELEDRLEEVIEQVMRLEKKQNQFEAVSRYLPFLLGELEVYFCSTGFSSPIVERTVKHNIKDAIRSLKEACDD